jgi:hypothetical protein
MPSAKLSDNSPLARTPSEGVFDDTPELRSDITVFAIY